MMSLLQQNLFDPARSALEKVLDRKGLIVIISLINGARTCVGYQCLALQSSRRIPGV